MKKILSFVLAAVALAGLLLRHQLLLNMLAHAIIFTGHDEVDGHIADINLKHLDPHLIA